MSKVPSHKKITAGQIEALARRNGIEPAVLYAFAEVEGSGIGFSDVTGRMLIQFEPKWMHRFLKEKPEGTWMNNPIGNQTVEYQAFASACLQNKEAAMKATSFGMMQVMGFHYAALGFKTVSEMWVYADQSEINQLEIGVRFIKSNPALYKALKEKNWHLVATYYNGAGYRALASKLNTTPYDIRFANAYKKFAASSAPHRTTTTVNIRGGAGVQHPLAGPPLRVNTALEILQRRDGWAQVKVVATGVQGWVCERYIT